MSFAVLAVSVLLAHSPQQVPAPPDCLAAADEAMSAYCAGEDLLRQSGAARQVSEREAFMKRAAESFRRAANTAKDAETRKQALARLESVYDADHLDQPREIEPILRELIAASPGDNAPIFKLARLQEMQELYDAAESTLLSARQQRMDDPEPYRELAKFFERRANTLSGRAAVNGSKTHIDPDAPDEGGVYSPGGSIPSPERTAGADAELPAEARTAGVSGSVLCEIVVDEKGRVTDAKVARSVPMLDEAALAAVRTWRFQPSMLAGRAVPVRLQVEVTFQ